MIKKAAIALGAILALPDTACAATLLFDFNTVEPFVAGGQVSFSIETSDPLPIATFVEASSLKSFSPGVARVRFSDACFTFVPGSSSSVRCDVVEVVVNGRFGTTLLSRLLQDGALSTVGSYTNV